MRSSAPREKKTKNQKRKKNQASQTQPSVCMYVSVVSVLNKNRGKLAIIVVANMSSFLSVRIRYLKSPNLPF